MRLSIPLCGALRSATVAITARARCPPNMGMWPLAVRLTPAKPKDRRIRPAQADWVPAIIGFRKPHAAAHQNHDACVRA